MEQRSDWWNADGDEAANRATQAIAQINMASVGIHADHLRHTRMYENRDYIGAAVSAHMIKSYTSVRRNRSNQSSRMALNITKSCIDTLVSKLGKEKVKPVYLTNGGIIERREKAEKLNKWLYGLFHECGVYHWQRDMLRKVFTYSKAGAKVFTVMEDGKPKIKCEPIFPPELLVDPYDAYYGNPLNLYQQKFLTKDLLYGNPVFAKNQKAIAGATTIPTIAGAKASDTTIVWEAWRRATEGKPGKHMIFTDAGILFEEEYTRRDFPIVFMDYTSPLIGFWGVGVAEELVPLQVELNRISNHIRDSMIIGSNPRVYMPIGANIDKNHMSNRIGGLVPFAGSQPPIHITPQSVGRDVFEQMENIYRKGFEIVGINLMSASGRNTLGASASGEAIRSYNDIETERFADTQQNFEDWNVRLARALHHEARQIVKDHGHFIINTIDEDQGVGSIDFADIDIPDDSMSIQNFPMSALPQEPGFRFATVKEWKDEGYVDQEEARELMSFPDLKSKTRYITAPRKVIESLVEGMALQKTPKGDKWITYEPEPYMDLPYAIQFGARMYNFLLLELPEDTDTERKEKDSRLNLVREWIEKVNLLGQANQPEPEVGMAPPGMEAMGGMPMPGMAPQAIGMPPQALTPEMAMGPQVAPGQ